MEHAHEPTPAISIGASRTVFVVEEVDGEKAQ
jgi:hypothetical protein